MPKREKGQRPVGYDRNQELANAVFEVTGKDISGSNNSLKQWNVNELLNEIVFGQGYQKWWYVYTGKEFSAKPEAIKALDFIFTGLGNMRPTVACPGCKCRVSKIILTYDYGRGLCFDDACRPEHCQEWSCRRAAVSRGLSGIKISVDVLLSRVLGSFSVNKLPGREFWLRSQDIKKILSHIYGLKDTKPTALFDLLTSVNNGYLRRQLKTDAGYRNNIPQHNISPEEIAKLEEVIATATREFA